MIQRSNSRNLIFTPHNSQCRVCHYSGYSNECNYFSTGKCPLVTGVKSIVSAKVA